MATAPDCLFVYGTLQDPQLVEQLLGKSLPSCTATLPGYRRVEPPGCYPYAEADAAAALVGRVLQGIDAEALSALDRYEGEGELYQRIVATAVVGTSQRPAWVYIGIPDAHPLRR
jgi:gamma-glutamylcyclotransferase (GGCT)/AIG2-like uncharacterized protein YtfP